MDWEFLTGHPMPPQSQLLHGCYLEAERADRVAQGLDSLRSALKPSFHGHMVGVTDTIRQSATHLRDLAARAVVPHSRTAVVANHLNVALPCLSRTLRDITAHYEDVALKREDRWRKMYHDMLAEAGGIPLPQRFLLYNHFFVLLIYLLTRDRRVDLAQLAQLRTKILELRRLRGIPDPAQIPTTTTSTADAAVQQQQQPPAVVITAPTPGTSDIQQHLIVPRGGQHPQQQPPIVISVVQQQQQQRPHWCDRLFALFAQRATNSGGLGGASITVLSAMLVPGRDQRRPAPRRTLMRRGIDGGRFCVKFVLAGHNEEPCVVLRSSGAGGGGEPMMAWGWHDQLMASRMGGNVVMLERWSQRTGAWKGWAQLGFGDWEELVLFYTAFVVLKARDPLSHGVNRADYFIADEDVLSQGKIVDDGYEHTIMVMRDQRTARMRLLTVVAEGELKQCPVWTAFVPASARHFRIVRESRHVVHIEGKGLQLYVFCDKYRESRMRLNRSGPFEIYFVHAQDADEFMYVFSRPDAPALVSSGGRDQEAIAGPSYSQ